MAKFFREDGACDKLGVKPTKLAQLVKDGRIKRYKFGPKISVYLDVDLDKLIDQVVVENETADNDVSNPKATPA